MLSCVDTSRVLTSRFASRSYTPNSCLPIIFCGVFESILVESIAMFVASNIIRGDPSNRFSLDIREVDIYVFGPPNDKPVGLS